MERVVIIDDEKHICNILKTVVPWEELGMKIVGEAENGLAGLELCAALQPDIILTDIRMPGIDGLELVERLHGQNVQACMILISGHDDFSYAQRAIHAGVLGYILKPIEEEELIELLQKAQTILEKRRRDGTYIKRLKSEIAKLQSPLEEPPEGEAAPVDDGLHSTVQMALRYLEHNYNQEISLDSVAARFFMHNTYFSQLFKKEIGTGFNDYLNRLRIDKAKLLLRQPHLKITEIADMTGFHNTSYFARVFKKYVGMAPAEFRDCEQ